MYIYKYLSKKKIFCVEGTNKIKLYTLSTYSVYFLFLFILTKPIIILGGC